VLCTKEEHQINRRTEIKITGIREVDPAQAKRLEDEERRSFDTESDYLEFQEVAIIKITET
jgi:hypothetical protein